MGTLSGRYCMDVYKMWVLAQFCCPFVASTMSFVITSFEGWTCFVVYMFNNIAVRTKCWKLTLSLRNSIPAEKKPNILEKEVLVKYNYWSKYFKLLGLQTCLGSRLISVFHLLKQCCLWNSKKNQRQWM